MSSGRETRGLCELTFTNKESYTDFEGDSQGNFESDRSNIEGDGEGEDTGRGKGDGGDWGKDDSKHVCGHPPTHTHSPWHKKLATGMTSPHVLHSDILRWNFDVEHRYDSGSLLGGCPFWC